MKPLVLAPQILAVYVGIELGGGEIGVAEHLLNRSQVRPALQQVGGERVSEGMRRHSLLYS
jgi:hypothetical protein